MENEKLPVLKCGCTAMTRMKTDNGDIPSCIIHDCTEVVKDQPNLQGRKARCDYYGKTVKTGSYNANACDKCISGQVCKCERNSNSNLWFFKYKPDEKFDRYYCACHGAD